MESQEVLLQDLNKRLQKLTKKIDDVLNLVSGYESRLRLIESTQINNNFDLVNLKEMFHTEIERRVEIEKKIMGMEDMITQHYGLLHDDILNIKDMLSAKQ